MQQQPKHLDIIAAFADKAIKDQIGLADVSLLLKALEQIHSELKEVEQLKETHIEESEELKRYTDIMVKLHSYFGKDDLKKAFLASGIDGGYFPSVDAGKPFNTSIHDTNVEAPHVEISESK